MAWYILIAGFVVMLVTAAVMDMRSRRTRGHALTPRMPGRMARRAEARALMSRLVGPSDYHKHRARRPDEDIPEAD